ncbi:MAG: acyl-CoA thioesterase [Phycisphaerae bacterium]|nr:acyl-CoA thioesterase [Phycisphaerae bacterium]
MATSKTIKNPAQSVVETRYLVMPHQANPFGTAFGGVIMSWIDMVASMAAQRHCGTEVVTASIDSLSFQEPVRIGDHVVLLASVNYVGKTSLEVGVKVMREDPITHKRIVATKAYLTFVSIDENHKPIPVPPLKPKTDDEKRRWNNAALRVKARKALRKQVQANNS